VGHLKIVPSPPLLLSPFYLINDYSLWKYFVVLILHSCQIQDGCLIRKYKKILALTAGCKCFCSHATWLRFRHMTEYASANTVEFLGDIPQISKEPVRCVKCLKDTKLNSLDLTLKICWDIYLSLEINSFS